ncbi:MAG: alpha/beta fold hydrolase [Acidimicrobiales bacterium]
MNAPRPVVLVHGAFHGAWCWAPLQAALDRRGVPSYAVDLPGHGASTAPLTDLAGNAASVAALLERLGDEVVLVGHSYGGAVISEAGLSGRVAHLVYLTALVPDVGESAHAQLISLPSGPPREAKLFLRHGDDALAANPDLGREVFYNECAEPDRAAALARLCPQLKASLAQELTVAAWRSVPSTYVRCTKDNAIVLAAQDVLAKRCTSVATLEADHSPFIHAPEALAEVLAPLAQR